MLKSHIYFANDSKPIFFKDPLYYFQAKFRHPPPSILSYSTPLPKTHSTLQKELITIFEPSSWTMMTTSINLYCLNSASGSNDYHLEKNMKQVHLVPLEIAIRQQNMSFAAQFRLRIVFLAGITDYG